MQLEVSGDALMAGSSWFPGNVKVICWILRVVGDQNGVDLFIW